MEANQWLSLLVAIFETRRGQRFHATAKKCASHVFFWERVQLGARKKNRLKAGLEAGAGAFGNEFTKSEMARSNGTMAQTK